MALSKDIYKAFEDVVGAENICDDPLIMPSYHNSDLAAVVLPGNAEEVQAVVRLCNRYNIAFRGVATGWTNRPYPSGIIYMDLRRMNRIIEINEKNMYAVVEPYVTSAQLQAELMKRGLNCNIKGAGSNCTAIIRGQGHMDQSTGGVERNQLALEWVTPDGEIVRSGSLGSSDEWFCGDGPGLSLRGVVSGKGVAVMEMGIYTKSAMKLYHWPGPSRFPLEGISPRYTMSEVPPGFMVRYISFPSYDDLYEAELKIGESEIAFEIMGFDIWMVAANITTCNEEELETHARLSKLIQGPGFMVIIAGNSPGDFEYKKQVLETIISETNGKSLEPIEDPKIEGHLLAHGIRISASIRETFRAGGLFSSIPMMGQRDLHIKWMKEVAEKKKELIKRGVVVDDGGVFFGWGIEQGHLGKTECFCRHKADPESLKAIEEWMAESAEIGLQKCYSVPLRLPVDVVGPLASNFHILLDKFREAFDPKGLATEVMEHMEEV